MKTKSIVLSTIFLMSFAVIVKAQTTKSNVPIVSEKLIFEEKDGLVAVEAEYFYKQTKSEIRSWYRTSKNELSKVGRDDDDQHCFGASNNSYLEILPDERVSHGDPLEVGKNFTDEAGTMAIIHYKVKINNPGRYYVWGRVLSTGGEDNGVHVGLNGQWPDSGQRMQWCDGRGYWTWASKQRTKEEHCGIIHGIYLDIEKAGIQDIQFSMREDGFELDKFILTKDINYVPIEKGPAVAVYQGKLPAPFPEVAAPAPVKSYFTNISKSIPENKVIASQEFPSDGTNFYKNGKNWLAINPKLNMEAQTSTIFRFESGKYDIVFVGVGENDGSSTFTVLLNGNEIGTYSPPVTNKLWEEGKDNNGLWENTSLKKGDKITVIGKVGSTDGKEHTRARWAGIIFTPVGKGKQVQEAPSTDEFVE